MPPAKELSVEQLAQALARLTPKRLDYPVQRELRDKHFQKLKENPRCGEPLRGSL